MANDREIAADDLKRCHLRMAMHARLSGGSMYIYQCVEHPRLSKSVTFRRKDRSVVTVWSVDGETFENLAAAVKALNAPEVVSP